MSIVPFTIDGPRRIEMLLDVEPGRYYSDDALLHYLNTRTCPEPEVVNMMYRLIKPGDVVIDAGANIGFFTILMSKLVGENGSVIAIEPDGRNYALLTQHSSMNECRNVEYHMDAIGENGRPVFFTQMQENGQSGIYFPEGLPNHYSMRLRGLDGFIAGRRPSFMKIDIEGAEYEALRNCDTSIPFIVCELNKEALERADSSVEELRELMDVWGHQTFLLHPDGSFPAQIDIKQKLIVSRSNTNVLFCNRRNLVKAWSEVIV